MKIFLRLFLILLCSLGSYTEANADSEVKTKPKQYIKSGNFAQCYFASIKANKANLHNGPGKQYKIYYTYVKKGLPVLVLAQYEHWRKIRDVEGTEGWIHKNLLSNVRYIIIAKETAGLYNVPDETAKPQDVVIKKNVVIKLLAVNKNWCNVKIKYQGNTYIGWVKKENVFGISKNEIW